MSIRTKCKYNIQNIIIQVIKYIKYMYRYWVWYCYTALSVFDAVLQQILTHDGEMRLQALKVQK